MSIKSTVMKYGTKAAMKISKHSPTICVVSGITMMVGGTVVACKKTTKAAEIIADHKERMKPIAEAKVLAKNHETIYSEKDEVKDTLMVFTQTGVKFAKLYAPAILLTAGGIALILTGHHILAKRYLAMGASYAGLQTTYANYRKRVVDEYGADVDYKFNNGIFEDENTESLVTYTDEEGNEQSKVIKKCVDKNGLSVYSVLFDEMYSTEWTPNPITNMAFIKNTQKYWNDRLQAVGWVYYYEVLNDLGIWNRLPEEKQRVLIDKGWVLGSGGDDCIDLGIFDINACEKDAVKEFVMGYEPSVLIDPNIDGSVPMLF